MNGSNVKLKAGLRCKLLAANLALVTSFSAGSLSVHRVVVSAEHRVVAERHVADLALDSGRACLYKHRNKH